MQGGSKRALHEVLATTAGVLGDGADAHKVGSDLFSLAVTLDASHSLRRALTEPAVPAEAKSRLLHSLFDGKVADASLAVADAGVAQRWSHTRDFCDALEQASVAAHVAQADDEGKLDDVEDNLFRFSRIADGNPALREALGDPAVPVEGKRSLLRDLLGDKVDTTTAALLAQAVGGRQRSLTSTLAMYQRVAADRRDSMIATVWVAAPMSQEHHDRLAGALSAQHHREVHLNVVVDPEVLGGVRVAVGDEVLDSTVESRLQQAQRRLER
jgi:F-type H+-transporting ATPase subunit delta